MRIIKILPVKFGMNTTHYNFDLGIKNLDRFCIFFNKVDMNGIAGNSHHIGSVSFENPRETLFLYHTVIDFILKIKAIDYSSQVFQFQRFKSNGS